MAEIIDAATASKIKNKAEELFNKGKYQEALSTYETIKSQGLKDPRIFMRIGDIARKAGNDKMAIKYYKDTVTIYVKQGFLIKAVAVCKMIISIDPSQDDIQMKLAELAASTGGAGGVGVDAPSRPATRSTAPVVQAEEVVEEVQEELQEAVAEPVAESVIESVIEVMGAVAESASKKPVKLSPDEKAALELTKKMPRTPLLSDLTEDELVDVIKQMSVKEIAAGEYLFREGDSGSSIFVVAEGMLEVIGRARNGNVVKLGKFSDGEFFGEYGFFSNSSRNTDVCAIQQSTVLEITKASMNEIISKHKRVEDVLFEFYKERIVDRLMGLSELFSPMSKEDRKEILARLTLKKFQHDDVIVKEGDKGDTMFLIKSGKVRAWCKDGSGNELTIGELSEGDFFGEIALATARPRMASISAIDEVELVEFSRVLIKDILMKYPAVKEALERIIKERVSDLSRVKDKKGTLV